MPEINLDDANSDSRALALIQAVQKHHALVKANRFLLAMVFVLMVAVFVMGAQESFRLSSFAVSNAIIEIPAETKTVEKGDWVTVYPIG
jgi:molybdopterin biosynthesis enzyme